MQERAAERRLGAVLEQHPALLIVEVGGERAVLLLGRGREIEDCMIDCGLIRHPHSPSRSANKPEFSARRVRVILAR